MFNIWTPDCSPPPGYKLLVHRYYTEIVPIHVNVPKTPLKTHRFFYDKGDISQFIEKNFEHDKDDKNDNNDNNDNNKK